LASTSGLCCGTPVPKARRQHYDSILAVMPALISLVYQEGTAFWLTWEEAEMYFDRDY
jgi:hypothetical protein